MRIILYLCAITASVWLVGSSDPRKASPAVGPCEAVAEVIHIASPACDAQPARGILSCDDRLLPLDCADIEGTPFRVGDRLLIRYSAPARWVTSASPEDAGWILEAFQVDVLCRLESDEVACLR